MKAFLIGAGVLGSVLAGPSLAEEAVMSRPIQAASLHAGPLDMVSYWQHLDHGGVELTATFRTRDPEALPMRIVMKLVDGDSISFAMPGYRSALYNFSRADELVTASVEVIPRTIAAR